MKNATVTISFNEEKLTTLKLYLSQKDLQVEDELVSTLEGMYIKYVPTPVRDYFDLRSGVEPETPKVRKPRQKKAKPDCETLEPKEVKEDGLD